MKTKSPALARSYLVALEKHLKRGAASSRQVARRLGLQAVKLGLDTLDVARIHEEAMITLVLPKSPARASDAIRLAGVFFAEAITPLEETHRGAREANIQLKDMIAALNQRTGELTAANKN